MCVQTGIFVDHNHFCDAVMLNLFFAFIDIVNTLDTWHQTICCLLQRAYFTLATSGCKQSSAVQAVKRLCGQAEWIRCSCTVPAGLLWEDLFILMFDSRQARCFGIALAAMKGGKQHCWSQTCLFLVQVRLSKILCVTQHINTAQALFSCCSFQHCECVKLYRLCLLYS